MEEDIGIFSCKNPSLMNKNGGSQKKFLNIGMLTYVLLRSLFFILVPWQESKHISSLFPRENNLGQKKVSRFYIKLNLKYTNFVKDRKRATQKYLMRRHVMKRKKNQFYQQKMYLL